MDASFVHSDACLIKKPERDYEAEFDELKEANDKYYQLQHKGRTSGLFGRPCFDAKTKEQWIKHQQAEDHANWEEKERQARAIKTKEDTAELLVLQLKLVKVQLAYYKSLGFE